MIELVGFVHEDVKDVVVINAKDVSNLCDKVKESLPEPFGDGEFQRVVDAVTEKAADGFIVGEPAGNGEYVVLDGGYSCACDLRGEVADAILAESEEFLAVLEDLMRSFS